MNPRTFGAVNRQRKIIANRKLQYAREPAGSRAYIISTSQPLLFGAYRVRGALNEGLDLHHIVFGELAGEVRHALILVWVFEDYILQVHDAFGRGIPKILDIAALVDAGHAMTGGAGLDIDRGSVRNILGIVLHAREQVTDLVFGKFRQRRLAADGEGVDRARPF